MKWNSKAFGKMEYKIKQKKELEKLLSEEERSLDTTNIKRNRGELKQLWK